MRIQEQEQKLSSFHAELTARSIELVSAKIYQFAVRERPPGSPSKRRRRSEKEERDEENAVPVEESADVRRPDSLEDDEDLIDAQLREVEEVRSFTG